MQSDSLTQKLSDKIFNWGRLTRQFFAQKKQISPNKDGK